MAWRKAHERILLDMLSEIACPKCGAKGNSAKISPKVESAKMMCQRCSHTWVHRITGDAV